MINITKKMGLAGLIATFLIGSANAFVLDTFDYEVDLQVNLSNQSATSTETTVAGFVADYTLNYYGADNDSDADADTVNAGGSSAGNLAYASSGIEGSELTVKWLAIHPLSTLPGNVVPVDFTAYGDSLYFDLDSIDLSFNIDLIIETLGGTDTFSALIDSAAVSTPVGLRYGFGNWAGVDFENVLSITAVMTGEPDADFRMSEFGVSSGSAAVPEPTTLTLLAFGLLGVAASRRKTN